MIYSHYIVNKYLQNLEGVFCYHDDMKYIIIVQKSWYNGNLTSLFIYGGKCMSIWFGNHEIYHCCNGNPDPTIFGKAIKIIPVSC